MRAGSPGILDLERELVSDRYEILRHGEGGAPTGLICGAVRFAHPAAGNLIEILPRTIRSEAAFSRAFKRVIGVSPGAIRRSAGEQDGALIAANAG